MIRAEKGVGSIEMSAEGFSSDKIWVGERG